MSFEPSSQALACPYCKHRVEIESGTESIKELDLEAGEAECSTDWGSQTKVIHCDNCGADTVLEAHQVALNCSFCGSSHVAVRDVLPGIRPGAVVPFAVSREKARESFQRWIKGRFFAPGDLKNSHQIEMMTGTYIPYWTYDADTYSAYSAQRGTYYYVTEAVTVNRNGKMVTEHRQVRKIRWNFVSGTHAEFFDDVLTHSSERLDNLLGKRVGSFDLSKLVDYRPEYLSGFVAEKYSIGLKEGWERAKTIIRERLNLSIRRRIGGDEVRALTFRTSYDKLTFKHVLLPLWISSYQYQGKAYNFVVNGQSGQVEGTAPVSAAKVAVAVLAVLAVIAVIVFYMTG
jgi:Zn finger protein HypA/HybF involved in hydrogenase expression